MLPSVEDRNLDFAPAAWMSHRNKAQVLPWITAKDYQKDVY